MTESLHGRFVWYELMTSDVEAAKAFYPKVTGWSVEPFQGPMEYFTWSNQGVPVGGLMATPPDAAAAGAPPSWMMYVGADNVDATYARALELGAKSCVPPSDIPSIGRFAVVFDPQGASFAIFTPAPMEGGDMPAGAPSAGQFSWHELATTDHAAAMEFYRSLFGWEQKASNDMGPMGIYRVFGRGAVEWGGMFNKPPQMPAPPHWMLYVRVSDINRAADAVKANGGRVLNGPMQVPGGHWIAQCLDPQGAAFALHQDKSENRLEA